MKPDPARICFGLSLELDRRSLVIFLQLCGDRDFAEVISGRLGQDEIASLTDHLMGLVRRHLSEEEYHSLFLKDRRPQGEHRHQVQPAAGKDVNSI